VRLGKSFFSLPNEPGNQTKEKGAEGKAGDLLWRASRLSGRQEVNAMEKELDGGVKDTVGRYSFVVS